MCPLLPKVALFACFFVCLLVVAWSFGNVRWQPNLVSLLGPWGFQGRLCLFCCLPFSVVGGEKMRDVARHLIKRLWVVKDFSGVWLTEKKHPRTTKWMIANS